MHELMTACCMISERLYEQTVPANAENADKHKDQDWQSRAGL